MNSLKESSLMHNIARFSLDSRIGKAVLSVKGTSMLMGERVSTKPGSSPVIMDYRNYDAGDPVKDIDWKLFGRTERLYVKIREGHRQTDFVIAIDDTESMKTVYSNSDISKFVTALTLAYIAGRVALKSRDRVYVWWKGERIRINSEPHLLNTLLDIETGTASLPDDLWVSEIETTANLFVLSDFFEEVPTIARFFRNHSHLTRNIFAISIQDPHEKDFDFGGKYRFLDTESEDSVLAESHDIKKTYDVLYADHFHEVVSTCRSFGAKIGVMVTTDDPFHGFVKAVS